MLDDTETKSIELSIGMRLAKNLVAARISAKLSQQELAELSNVSRATIAQIESGGSLRAGEGLQGADPRLSTLQQLANALDISPVLLLISRSDLIALARFSTQRDSLQAMAKKTGLDQGAIDELGELLATGVQAAQKKAINNVVEKWETAGIAVVGAATGAAIGTVLVPGVGTLVGAALGAFLGRRAKPMEELGEPKPIKGKTKRDE